MVQPLYENENRYEQEDRSLGGLLSDLTNQVSTLVSKEIELAKVEMSQKLSRITKDTMMMGMGGVLLYAGLLTLVAAAVYGLAEWLALWLSALIVAAVVLLVGGILFGVGKKRLQKRDIKPTQTIISLKENKKWIKGRM